MVKRIADRAMVILSSGVALYLSYEIANNSVTQLLLAIILVVVFSVFVKYIKVLAAKVTNL
ncbi:hypothetical protein [Halorussus sp. MSC15.2]|uniref:hypothetical protein n=1 Tax=Halorussus sp. MSC15.2 TaxID=2283638 RepID=UPI0013D69C92|nr:hypothetical protein [Halorussus sp. MSC15.2]NEU55242.1 hypothetical protein [Halorussus sp. MSC15.2]